MKLASLALATALIAIVGSVQPTLAQNYDSSGDNAGNSSDSGQNMNAPAHPHHQWSGDRDWGPDHEMREGRWDHEGMWRHHHMGMMDHHMGMMGMMGMHSRGARFHFKRGDAVIDIRCPSNENVEACVNAASKLISKVASMGEHHPTAPGANPPSPPPPPKTAPPSGGTNGSGGQNGGNSGPNGPAPGHTAPPFNNRT